MIISKTIPDLDLILAKRRSAGDSIGFVPTMGALHDGHISLVSECKTHDGFCVCSIFINPTQFNNAGDFEKYPVTLGPDIARLEASGCDLLFLPAVSEMYPPGGATKHYELGYLENILEGKFRPGHFQGVCQIVDKLLAAIIPDNLYMGQKDYQQCMIIRKMIGLAGYKTNLQIMATKREKDGLAMSSRNLRLTGSQRAKATAISQVLYGLGHEIHPGNISSLKLVAKEKLEIDGFKPDYVEIADAATLLQVENWDGTQKLVALVAAFLDEIRLIDNMLLN